MEPGTRLELAAAVFPIAVLVWLVAKRRPVPASKALPAAAAVLYLSRLFVSADSPRAVHAAVIDGFLTALTPLLIVWGAVLLFKTMEHSGAMASIAARLDRLTTNRVGQLMLVGWSFSFLIEGISGFGTPAAIAAPLLVSLGYPAVSAAAFCLILNTVPVSFGAVGTPIWFGLGQLGLTPAETVETGFKTAVLNAAAAAVVPALALRLLVSWREIRRNLLFVCACVLASVVPYVALARVDAEFPSVLGGIAGLAAGIVLAKAGWGLDRNAAESGAAVRVAPTGRSAVQDFFPLAATAAILLATRIPALGLKSRLTDVSTGWKLDAGLLGDFSLSPALVFRLDNILGTDTAWSHAALYVPSILPFGLVSAACFVLYRMSRGDIGRTLSVSWGRTAHAAPALLGAMVFAKLFMLGGNASAASAVGGALAEAAGGYWKFVAVYLGALGAFFSGSNTVSNLMFGPVQLAVAASSGLTDTTVLALQSAGGAMGNMACLYNIVAVTAVLGVSGRDGEIFKKTIPFVLIYGAAAGAAAAVLFA